MAKLGKDIKYIYETLDKDKSGSCIFFHSLILYIVEKNELLHGLKNSFNVYFSEEEITEVT